METFFASPERATHEELAAKISNLARNPLIDGLMAAANSLFTVLDEHRQVIAINESFLKLMGIEDAASVLGLRPGEMVNCVHSHEMEGGCGTSSYCSTCGAVIAIVSAMELNGPVERTCAITVERYNKEAELFFQVRCCPVDIEGSRFVLMFLQDISLQQQNANLERTFFHDMSNVLMALGAKSDMLSKDGGKSVVADVQKLVTRLIQEFSVQKTLSHSLVHTYQPLYREFPINRVLSSLDEMFLNNSRFGSRTVDISSVSDDLTLVSDENLVRRILENMINNALEASDEHGTVKVFVEPGGSSLSFCVWNRRVIPEDIGKRIFQRNFTTKDGLGHGLGTFSMKLFGEQVLGGAVGFSSSEKDGTLFRFTLMQ